MASLKVYDGSEWVTIRGLADHGQLNGLGDNDHPQYVLSGTNLNLSNAVTSNGNDIAYVSGEHDSHIGSSTVHFTEASINHSAIAGLGGDDHPQYVLSGTNLNLSNAVTSNGNDIAYVSGEHDNHTGSSTVHFTEASINHSAIAGLGGNDHPQYVVASAGSFTTVAPNSNVAATVANELVRKAEFDADQLAQNNALIGFLATYTPLTTFNSHATSGPAHSTLLEKSITIESPTDTDTITIMNAVQGYDINSINTVLSGTTSPSAAWSLYKGSDRTAGTLVVASGTGSLTGETIPVTGSVSASEYLWIEITSVAGTIDTLHLSMHMGIT